MAQFTERFTYTDLENVNVYVWGIRAGQNNA